MTDDSGVHARPWPLRLAVPALLAFAVAGCAAEPPSLPPGEAPLTPPVQEQLVEELALPPIDGATMEWLNRLQSAVAGDPNFGTVAIDDTRRVVTITWFGEHSPTLTEHLEKAPETIDVVVHPAAFQPAELQQLVLRAMGRDFLPDVQFAMGGVSNDASGLTFGIVELPGNQTLEQVAERIAVALGRPDVPVEVQVTGQVVPISG